MEELGYIVKRNGIIEVMIRDRKLADEFLDMMCGVADTGTTFSLEQPDGTVLVAFDENGNQTV